MEKMMKKFCLIISTLLLFVCCCSTVSAAEAPDWKWVCSSAECDYEFDADNVRFGKNKAGKTVCVDVWIKMTLSDEGRAFLAETVQDDRYLDAEYGIILYRYRVAEDKLYCALRKSTFFGKGEIISDKDNPDIKDDYIVVTEEAPSLKIYHEAMNYVK